MFQQSLTALSTRQAQKMSSRKFMLWTDPVRHFDDPAFCYHDDSRCFGNSTKQQCCSDSESCIFGNARAITLATIPETCSLRPCVEVTPGDDVGPVTLLNDRAVTPSRRTLLWRSHDRYATIPKAALGVWLIHGTVFRQSNHERPRVIRCSTLQWSTMMAVIPGNDPQSA